MHILPELSDQHQLDSAILRRKSQILIKGAFQAGSKKIWTQLHEAVID